MTTKRNISSSHRSLGETPSSRRSRQAAARHASGRQLNDFSRLDRGGRRSSSRHSQSNRGRSYGRGYNQRPLDKEAFSVKTGNGDIVLTRRNLLFGALGVGVLAAAGVGAKTITDNAKAQDEVAVLKVSKADVTESTSMTDMGYQNQLYLSGSAKLPYGTLIWASNDDYAALLIPTQQGQPLTQIGLLRLSSGYWFTILEQALGLEQGFEVYDVRVSDQGIVWTEVDILQGVWRIYGAPLVDAVISNPLLLEEGDADWETPSIAICGLRAFWQVLPNLKGSKSREASTLRTCLVNSQSSLETVLESNGRMRTPIYALDDSIVVTPRANTEGVNYELTLVDAETLMVSDSVVLPQSMKPLEAGYGKNGFTFSFEGIYNYGDGISNLGTYTPKVDVRFANHSNVPWFHFNRTPSAPPCWCGDYFVVKSSKSVVCCNLEQNSYFIFDVESGCADYGDYLASTGVRQRIVTYTNINDNAINGSSETYCSARIWTAPGA